MSQKQKTSVRASAERTNSPHPITDRARNAALAEIGQRITGLDAANNNGTASPTLATDATVASESAHKGSPEPAAHGGASGKGDKKRKGAKEPKPAKEPKAKPAPKEKKVKAPKPKRVSALDAAAQVLAASKKPMKAIDLIAEMESKGLWKSKSGRTPEATLYAAVIREIAAKGKDARFKKHDRGLFVAGKVS